MKQIDKIKAMNAEEMAKFIFDMIDCVSCTNKLNRSDIDCKGDGRLCLKVTRKWLESEVTE